MKVARSAAATRRGASFFFSEVSPPPRRPLRRRDGARRGVEEVREPDALEARARGRVAPEGLEPERALERGRGGRAGPHANARVSSRVVFV